MEQKARAKGALKGGHGERLRRRKQPQQAPSAPGKQVMRQCLGPTSCTRRLAWEVGVELCRPLLDLVLQPARDGVHDEAERDQREAVGRVVTWWGLGLGLSEAVGRVVAW